MPHDQTSPTHRRLGSLGRLGLSSLLGFLMMGVATPIWAQRARVVDGPVDARIRLSTGSQTWRVESGAIVDVLTRDGDWQWVVLPRDPYGTSRSVWIPTTHLEATEAPPSTLAPLTFVPGTTATVTTTEPDRVRSWLTTGIQTRTAAPGTTVEILQTEGAWHWVLLQPDVNGTRRSGWLRREDLASPSTAVH